MTICVLVTQPCPTLCNPIEGSLPSSSVHGVLQTRILKRVASSSSRGFPDPDPGMKPGLPDNAYFIKLLLYFTESLNSKDL